MSSSSSHDIPNHIVIYDLPWKSYTGMIDALGEKHVPHVYQQGTLEMMSPSHEHESISRFLARLLGMAAYQLRVELLSVGSTTRRHQKADHGFEPDESFYVGVTAATARKLTSAAAKRLPPDLAVEIEWSRAVLKKLDSYAVLGVREVWRYYRRKVEFLVLNDEAKYEVVERSRFFPQITAAQVTRLVGRLKDDDQNVLLDEFLDALRKSKKS